MADFDMPWEKEEAKVTPIICSVPTNEEMEAEFKKIFEEEWRKTT